MEITKRWFSILLILCAALCAIVAQPARRHRVPQATWDNYALKITEQVPQFGGFWYQNGRPVVGLTNLTASAKAKSKLLVLAAMKTRENETGPFTYQRVDHNFATIHRARRKIRPLFRERLITFLDTDERRNRVKVGIRKASDEPTVRQKIVGMGIAESMLKIEVRAPVKDLDLIQDLRQRVRPLVGGVETVTPAGNNRWSICSLGLVGRRNGVRGLLTNSHCTRVHGQLDGEPFFQYHWTESDNTPDNPGDRVGVETVDAAILTSADTGECDEGDRCQYADAAFVALDSTVGARRGFVKGLGGGAPVEYEIKDVVYFGACGQKVKKVGRTTGLTRGEVESTCADFEFESGLYKLCQDEISAGAGHGDSGSAALLEHVSPNSGWVKFYGLVHGGDSDHIVVSPYLMVLSQLGGNIDVKPGNDPPQVRITTPMSGASFGMNPLSDKVRFEANIFDPEGKQCGTNNSTCTVEWRSDKDGVIGTGRTAEFLFKTKGLHSITATAKDGSLTGFDQIAINISSTPPNIQVVEPDGGPYYRGIPYILYATATDSDVSLLVPVECNRFTWSSNNQSDLGTGAKLPENFCEVIHTFTTLGSRTLSVQARDPGGDVNTKTIPINVVARPTTGHPIISMLITSRVIGKNPNSIYNLRAAIVDPDGGQRLSYKWKIKYGETEKIIKSAQRGSSAQILDPWRPSDHVPNRCGGWNTTLTLEVEDDQGQKSKYDLPIYVAYPLC